MDADANKQVVARFDALGNAGGDLTGLDVLCTPDTVNHALAPTMPAGIEGTRQFLDSARRAVHEARWLTSFVVAENNLVVQFGEREHHWPGGSFRGYDVPAGTQFSRAADRIAIRSEQQAWRGAMPPGLRHRPSAKR
jgi:hypothetical protein